MDAAATPRRYRRSMTISRPSSEEAALALGCAAWDLAFVLGHDPALAPVALVTGLAVLAHRRRPLLASAGVAGVLVAQMLLGVPAESPSGVAAALVVTYSLGRHATPPASLALLAVVAGALAVSDPTVPTVAFVGVLAGGVWTIGHLVRRRTQRAAAAAAAVADLSALDPAARATRAVAEERARLAGEVLGTVRAAVVTMDRHAAVAAPALDRTELVAIQQEGRHATAELRRLLGLLRSEPGGPDNAPDASPALATGSRAPAPVWRIDVATAVGVVILGLLEAGIEGRLTPGPSVVLLIVLAATLALRRTDPVVACALACLPPGTALLLGSPVPYGLWSGIVLVLLAWSVTGQGRLVSGAQGPRVRAFATLGVLVATVTIDGHRDEPGNVPLTLAIIVVAIVAGSLWADRGREERSADAAAAALRSRHAVIADAAVRAERLRLARDLHDVTSHAVGVMVLQAGAAEALRVQAPDRAHAALAAVRAAAAEAMVEIDALLDLLDAGAVGAAGLAGGAGAAGTDLANALRALTDRIGDAGLRVTLELVGELPTEPPVATASYRVVQETLTNALRYAPRAVVAVSLRVEDGLLEVAVRDDGGGTTGTTPIVGGFGLVGVTERVRSLGGDVAVGPLPGGGFAVTARLPVRRTLGVRP